MTYTRLPGSNHWQKGIVFGVGAWLIMMVGPMPMSGSGLFGLSIGSMAPVITLVFHIVFGAAMGGTFNALNGPDTGKASP